MDAPTRSGEAITGEPPVTSVTSRNPCKVSGRGSGPAEPPSGVYVDQLARLIRSIAS